MKRLLMVFVFVIMSCCQAWGAYEKSGIVYYPTDGTSAAALLVGIEAKGTPCTMKFIHTSGVSTPYIFSSGVTFPEYVTLEFENGAVLQSPSATLRIDGPIDAGRYQIFADDTTPEIWIASGGDELYPEWFGVTMDGETDSSDAMQRCVNTAINVGTSITGATTNGPIGTTIHFGTGIMLASGVSIVDAPGVSLKGSGMKSTVWKGASSGATYCLLMTHPADDSMLLETVSTITNMKFEASSSIETPLLMIQIARYKIEDVVMAGNRNGYVFVTKGCLSWSMNNCLIYGNYGGAFIDQYKYGGTNVSNNIKITNTTFDGQYDKADYGTFWGLYCETPGLLSITGCEFAGWGATVGGHLPDGSVWSGATVSTASAAQTGAIYLHSLNPTASGTAAVISNTWVEGNGGVAINLGGTDSYISGKKVVLRNVDQFGTSLNDTDPQYGLYCANRLAITIESCNFLNNVITDIYIPQAFGNISNTRCSYANYDSDLISYEIDPTLGRNSVINTATKIIPGIDSTLIVGDGLLTLRSDKNISDGSSSYRQIAMLQIDQDSGVSVSGIKIDQYGGGNGISIENTGVTPFQVGANAIRVYTNADEDLSPLVYLNSNNGGSSQPILYLVNAGTGGTIADDNGAVLTTGGVWTDAPSFWSKKTNITPVQYGGYTDKLKNLDMYIFQKKSEVEMNPDSPYYLGYMIDDESTPDELKGKDINGETIGISPSDNASFLMAVIKELIERIEALEAE